MCSFHNVYLPLEKTETYVICSRWQTYRLGQKLSFFELILESLGLNHTTFFRKNNFNLYTATQFYTDNYKKFVVSLT